MVDVSTMPANSFGYVPTPAIVAPIEFTLRRDHYRAMGGHIAAIRPLAEVLTQNKQQRVGRTAGAELAAGLFELCLDGW